MSEPGSLELLTTNDPDLWDGVLEEIGDYDFYYLSSYHRLAELRGEGKAVMPVYRENGCVIAFPFLLREIPQPAGLVALQGLNDVISVRGLVSPFASAREVPEDVRQRYLAALQNFFERNRIVAAYARFHPLVGQQSLLEGCGKIVPTGYIMALDLTESPETQLANYRKSHRYEVRRLLKMGFTWEQAGPEHLGDFLRLYHGTMDRVHAIPALYFDKTYFSYLINEMSTHTCMLVCKDGARIVCAGILAAGKRFAHALFVATDSDYIRLSPSKLIFDAGRQWANSIGAEFYDLGGNNCFVHDSLSDFKLGFGAREHTYSTWRHVVDPRAYEQLCAEACRRAGKTPDKPYFPMYRHPDLQLDEVNTDGQSS